MDALREQLRTLGYIEGRNIAFEYRWAAGLDEGVQALAEELVQLQVDMIVTVNTFVALAAKRATSAIPIVMAGTANPVGFGVVASLARPGGNVTGVTNNITETDGKRPPDRRCWACAPYRVGMRNPRQPCAPMRTASACLPGCAAVRISARNSSGCAATTPC